MAGNGTIPTKQNMSAKLRLAADAMGGPEGDQWYNREMSRLGDDAPAPDMAAAPPPPPPASITPVPTTPASPAPTGGTDGGGMMGNPAMKGLQGAMAAGWGDQPPRTSGATALGTRTPNMPVTVLSDVMRRFGRTY